MTWSSSKLGQFVAGAPAWQLSIDDEKFSLSVNSKNIQGSVLRLVGFEVRRGFFWSRFLVPTRDGQPITLGGLPSSQARELQSTLVSSIARAQRKKRLATVLEASAANIERLVQWKHDLLGAVEHRFRHRGWLDHLFIQTQISAKPTKLTTWLGEPDVQTLLHSQGQEVQSAALLYLQDLHSWLEEKNRSHEHQCLNANKEFFDKIEKSALTLEQRKAVVCFDSRMLLVASAGSGKTSTMVAKAAYALKRGYFKPESILLLAFNNDAAAELRQRLKERLLPLGLPAEGVSAKTFHAFGLEVIGQATGKKPSLAPWIDSGRDQEMLLTLVDEIKDKDPRFRVQWDLFRVVLAQDLPEFGKEQDSPDSWSRENNRQGFWTLNNEVVKSRGESVIANWLFYNGVEYVYEKPYEHDTADARHRQYHPDFFLPEVNAYLEHWAVDENGNPPAEFTGYKEGMQWKRELHARHGTRLLETTMADLWSGQAFEKLGTQLTKLGLTLDPNPDRPAPGRQPIESPRLARNIRMFQTHVKNNRLSFSQLRERLSSGGIGRFSFRHRMFLDIFEPIHLAWEKRLRDGGYIDFEDMLNMAAQYLEQKCWNSPYELVMVDEFQDASQARARLAKALVEDKDACLFAVGDDWQSINRFAGADLAVMTQFSSIFGPSRTLMLETTFRCPQSLCDVSSKFIQKNPIQLRKTVRATRTDVQEAVRLVKVDDERQIGAAVLAQLSEIAADAEQSAQIQKVYIMGRYRRDRDYLPSLPRHPLLDVQFITAHSSKGLECDHVILPRMTAETMGFPSRIEDDPVLALAMPGSDGYEYSEERRLFYVALTRAKHSVRLITCAKRESNFLMELVKDHNLTIQRLDGQSTDEELCPECGKGFLVTRKGPYGLFFGCSNFPPCTYKRKLPKAVGRTKTFPSSRTRHSNIAI